VMDVSVPLHRCPAPRPLLRSFSRLGHDLKRPRGGHIREYVARQRNDPRQTGIGRAEASVITRPRGR
jgi:hypothetical protein